MTEAQTETRREKSLIVAELARITDRPSKELWGIAGRIRKVYGQMICMEILPKIAAGNGLQYALGAVRNEARKNMIYQNLDELCEVWGG